MEMEIGTRIRSIRHRKKITLETLANWCGVTKGYLSKIERGLKEPAVSTLSRITKALGVTMGDLFNVQPPTASCAVIKKSERLVVSHRPTDFGYTFESLGFAKATRIMDAFVITFQPVQCEGPFMEHDGEELFFVLSGTVEFIHGETTHTLRAGDCALFDASVPHRARALKGYQAQGLMVIVSQKGLSA